MKANELFIGAHVEMSGKNRKIKSIVAKDTGVEVSFYGSNTVIVSLDMLRPIPLTPEILEKNGFKKEGSWFVIEDDYYDVSIKEITDSIWRVKYCNTEFSAFDCVLHIAFIHELQYALRLCGIEKEIVI